MGILSQRIFHEIYNEKKKKYYASNPDSIHYLPLIRTKFGSAFVNVKVKHKFFCSKQSKAELNV